MMISIKVCGCYRFFLLYKNMYFIGKKWELVVIKYLYRFILMFNCNFLEQQRNVIQYIYERNKLFREFKVIVLDERFNKNL